MFRQLRRLTRFSMLTMASGSALLCPRLWSAGAQSTIPAQSSSRVMLQGSTHPLAQAAYEQGSADTAASAGRLRIMLTRSADREQALNRFFDGVRDPNSPQYRKRLTPEQYGALFGATGTQISTVSGWLKQQGFTITRVPASKGYIEFSGNVGTVERAFTASLKIYFVEGSTHVANANVLSIPAPLQPYVAGIAPLNDFRVKAQVLAAGAPVKLISKNAKPMLSDSVKGTVFITPADAATLYNLPNARNRNASGEPQWDGAGVRIGIAGYSDLEHGDYLRYRRRMLNEANPPDAIDVIDGIDPGTLDQHDGQATLIAAEIASGIAPGAQLYIYSSQSDLLDNGYINAITRAIEDNTVDILELSYSTCEYYLGPAGNAQINELWKQAAAQGITVVVAAGDAGSAACDVNSKSATGGLAVNGLASSPYVISVGGTDFDLATRDFAQNLAEANAPVYQAALKGYVPESVWNDALQNSNNVDYGLDHAASYGSLVSAGGGGASSYVVCSGGYDANGYCQGYQGYAVPPFQVNTGMGATTRTVPDIALFAGTNRIYAATWAVCSDTAVAQAAQPINECDTPAADGSFSVEGAGGTGTSAPAFAGMLALLLQSQRPQQADLRLGPAANGMYNLDQAASGVFHDISSGNNSVPCTGSQDCGGNGFIQGQNARPGYDLASGLGSVDLGALIRAWPTISYAPTTLELQASTQSSAFSSAAMNIIHGDTVRFRTLVNPETAAGSVAVTGVGLPNLVGGLAINEITDLASGAGMVSTDKLPGGSYLVHAYYAGDATHGASESGPIQINVGRENSVLQLSTELQQPSPTNSGPLVPSPASFAYGTYGFIFAQPVGRHQPSGPATGHVQLFNDSAALNADGSPSDQALNSVGRAAYPFNLFSPGSYSVTANYGGDASYEPSQTTNPVAFTIYKASTQLTLQSSAESTDGSASLTISATLATDSTGAYPTGSVILLINGVNSGTKYMFGQVRQRLAPNNSDLETFAFKIPDSDLAGGLNSLQVVYGGDQNYNGTTKTASIMASGMSAAPAAFSVKGPWGKFTLPISRRYVAAVVTLQSLNGFSGSVHLTCAWKSSSVPNTAVCDIPASVTLTPYGFAYPFFTIIGRPTPYDGPQASSLYARSMGGIALCFVFLLKPVRRRAAYFLLLLPAALVFLGMFGCGAHTNPREGRQSGMFTAIVTGVSGSTIVTTEVPIYIE